MCNAWEGGEVRRFKWLQVGYVPDEYVETELRMLTKLVSFLTDWLEDIIKACLIGQYDPGEAEVLYSRGLKKYDKCKEVVESLSPGIRRHISNLLAYAYADLEALSADEKAYEIAMNTIIQVALLIGAHSAIRSLRG